MWLSLFQQASYPTPTLMLKEKNPLSQECQISIHINGISAVEGNNMDISLGLACLMACYYVYDLEYCAKTKNTLSFIAHYLCKLCPDKQPTKAVMKVANMLCYNWAMIQGKLLDVTPIKVYWKCMFVLKAILMFRTFDFRMLQYTVIYKFLYYIKAGSYNIYIYIYRNYVK